MRYSLKLIVCIGIILSGCTNSPMTKYDSWSYTELKEYLTNNIPEIKFLVPEAGEPILDWRTGDGVTVRAKPLLQAIYAYIPRDPNAAKNIPFEQVVIVLKSTPQEAKDEAGSIEGLSRGRFVIGGKFHRQEGTILIERIRKALP